MIRFSLTCAGNHHFEGWFASNADFDAQKERGLVECPECGSAEISKTLMAPSVATSRSHEKAPPSQLALAPEQREAMTKLRQMVKAVKESSENVGERFPEEARKIHYGEVEARGIFGRASGEEARALAEEGIPVAPLPDFAEDAN